MFRRIFSILVLMLTVLTVNLVTGFITDYIVRLDVGLDPMRFTAIAMLALVFILVPAYSFLSDRIEILAAKLLLTGGNSFGRVLGILLTFLLLFGILFCIYLYQLFGLSIFDIVKAGS